MSRSNTTRIEYQPKLVEEAVLKAIAGHPSESEFRRERNRIYELADAEAREEAFQVLNERWSETLDLGEPLQEVISACQILKSETQKCVVVMARSKKDVGAELYVVPQDARPFGPEQRSIVVQLTPELLAESEQFLRFLRHELLHIVDMLDPEYGYEPYLPNSEMGPIYDRILQERYRVLWDITIDGRLSRQGKLPSSAKQKHRRVFMNTFAGPTGDLETVFSFFFNNWPHTHKELVSFVQCPENWYVSSNRALDSRQCSVCRFPSFELVEPGTALSPNVVMEVRQSVSPDWTPDKPICRQCADLLESRFYSMPNS